MTLGLMSNRSRDQLKVDRYSNMTHSPRMLKKVKIAEEAEYFHALDHHLKKMRERNHPALSPATLTPSLEVSNTYCLAPQTDMVYRNTTRKGMEKDFQKYFNMRFSSVPRQPIRSRSKRQIAPLRSEASVSKNEISYGNILGGVLPEQDLAKSEDE